MHAIVFIYDVSECVFERAFEKRGKKNQRKKTKNRKYVSQKPTKKKHIYHGQSTVQHSKHIKHLKIPLKNEVVLNERERQRERKGGREKEQRMSLYMREREKPFFCIMKSKLLNGQLSFEFKTDPIFAS